MHLRNFAHAILKKSRREEKLRFGAKGLQKAKALPEEA